MIFEILHRALLRVLRISPRCEHKWEDWYDFVSCMVVHIPTNGGLATQVPETIQTMEYCPMCGEHRRKPNSARAASITGKVRA